MIFQTLNDKTKINESKPRFILTEKYMCIERKIELMNEVDHGSPLSETPPVLLLKPNRPT